MAGTQLRKHLHSACCRFCPGTQSPRSALETGAGGASGGRGMSQPFEVSLLVWWDLAQVTLLLLPKGRSPSLKKYNAFLALLSTLTTKQLLFAENSLKLCTSNGFVDDGPSRWLVQCFAVPSAATLCPDTRQSDERLFFSCSCSLPTPRTLT